MSGSVEGVVSNRDPYSDRAAGPRWQVRERNALFQPDAERAFGGYHNFALAREPANSPFKNWLLSFNKLLELLSLDKILSGSENQQLAKFP
jgi:hypothetical protein